MRNYLPKIIIAFTVLICFVWVGGLSAQTVPNTNVKRNSPFSPNPKRKAESAKQPNETVRENEVKYLEAAEKLPVNQTLANKTREIAKRRTTVSAPPTEIYRVGTGDVLDIKILNSPANGSTLFTVLEGGTIDYPLAGNEPVTVENLTPEEIETLLAEKVKLYENTEITVSVRDYASHKISVLGLVERPGTKALRRVAIPLYVILAEAIPLSTAGKATILRGFDKETVTVGLDDSQTLVYAEDIVRVIADDLKSAGNQTAFYYIGGGVATGGQKEFHEGITLTQAILASGGLKKSSTRKATIRRRNVDGLLEGADFDLKAIRDGKAADPQLKAGDTIEIGN